MYLCDFEIRSVRILVFVLWQILGILLPAATAESELRQYCFSEYFNVSCGSRDAGDGNEVILMDSAQYGRMRSGRCASSNIGCSVDVLEFFDRQCSGRRQCAVYVSDPELHKLTPCSKDYTSYLEAKYTCVNVAGGLMSSCQRDRHITLSGKSVGYIASLTSTEQIYGTGSCPWKIEAEPGQTIRLSLLSFGTLGLQASLGGDGGTMVRPDACYEIMEIREVSGIGSVSDRQSLHSMCTDSKRENTFFVSTGNVVIVQLKSQESLKGLAPFIIKYEVRGCRPLKPPPGGHVKIDGNTATVRCNSSKETKETWFLTCTGSSWLGYVGNCSDRVSVITNNGDVASLVDDNFPYGILLVVAIGVALGVLIGGVLLSCVAYYMKRQTRLHGYAEPSEWTKQMLDEMEAYNEAKQLSNTRYIQDTQQPSSATAVMPIPSAVAAAAATSSAPVTSNRTVILERADMNTAIAHVKGCTCPKEEDYPLTSDCRFVLTPGGACSADSNQSRFLYEIPQFNH